jgi:hypothetical protein
MKKNSVIKTVQEHLQLHKNKENMDHFKRQIRITGVDIPGFGGHYPSLAEKGPMGRRPAQGTGDPGSHPDPCFWNRGGGRWFHSKRRGGRVGRQRERALPRAPFPD